MQEDLRKRNGTVARDITVDYTYDRHGNWTRYFKRLNGRFDTESARVIT